MNLKPLGDRVVVKPAEREETTSSGIVIPDTVAEKPQTGVVEAVGTGRVLDGCARVPMEVAVGDRALFARYSGSEYRVDDVEYLIVSEKDVLAVVSVDGSRRA